MTTTAPSTASPSVKQNRPAQRRHRTPIDRATLRLSVLIPVYNERHTIELILDEVASTPIQKEVIVVDDCSTDGTRDLLQELLDEGRIDRLHLQPVNRGKGAAIRQALSDLQASGAQRACDCNCGEEAVVLGRLRSVGLSPKESAPTLEAELFDGTEGVMLVWLGRRRIPGIEPGRTIKARGRIAERDGRKVLYNPYYELQTT